MTQKLRLWHLCSLSIGHSLVTWPACLLGRLVNVVVIPKQYVPCLKSGVLLLEKKGRMGIKNNSLSLFSGWNIFLHFEGSSNPGKEFFSLGLISIKQYPCNVKNFNNIASTGNNLHCHGLNIFPDQRRVCPFNVYFFWILKVVQIHNRLKQYRSVWYEKVKPFLSAVLPRPCAPGRASSVTSGSVQPHGNCSSSVPFISRFCQCKQSHSE